MHIRNPPLPVLLLLAFTSHAPAAPDSPLAMATVRTFSGTIAFRGRALPRGQALRAGDRLDLAPGAWVCMALPDETLLLFGANDTDRRPGQFQLLRHDVAGQRITLAMGEGVLAYSIPGTRTTPFVISVNTPVAELATRSGRGLVRSTRGGVHVGSRDSILAVRARADGQVASLGPDHRLSILPGKAPSAPVAWSWTTFVETDPLATGGGILCLEEAPPAGTYAGPLFGLPSGSTRFFVDGPIGRHPLLSLLLLAVLSALLLWNSATARTHAFLVSALVLEGASGISRLWITLGILRIPVGAAFLGWALLTWIERRDDRSTLGRFSLKLVGFGLLAWVIGVTVAAGPSALDVSKGTSGITGLTRHLLGRPVNPPRWTDHLRPAAWVRPDLAPPRFPLGIELLAFLAPLLLLRPRPEVEAASCRFCARDTNAGVKQLAIRASGSRLLWRLIMEGNPTEVIEALDSIVPGSRATTDLVMLEVKYAFCASCNCGEATFERSTRGGPEEKVLPLRGERHARWIESLSGIRRDRRDTGGTLSRRSQA